MSLESAQTFSVLYSRDCRYSKWFFPAFGFIFSYYLQGASSLQVQDFSRALQGIQILKLDIEEAFSALLGRLIPMRIWDPASVAYQCCCPTTSPQLLKLDSSACDMPQISDSSGGVEDLAIDYCKSFT